VTTFDFNENSDGKGTIDVWIVGSWDWHDLGRTLSLLLQLAHIIHEKKEWKKQTSLRLLQVIDPETSIGGIERRTSSTALGGSSRSLRSVTATSDDEVPIDLSAFQVGQNVRISKVGTVSIFLCVAPELTHRVWCLSLEHKQQRWSAGE